MGRGQMRVVFFGHAGVRVTQGGRHDLQWNTRLREKAGVAVAEDVERDGWLNLCVDAGVAHGTVLMPCTPGRPVAVGKHERVPCAPDGQPLKKLSALSGQVDMAGFAALALTNCER